MIQNNAFRLSKATEQFGRRCRENPSNLDSATSFRTTQFAIHDPIFIFTNENKKNFDDINFGYKFLFFNLAVKV